ncbi:MAG: hypothetical protein ACRD22_12720 [Terriglobia bacterium]
MSEESEADAIKAISALMAVLKPLDADARVYVLEFVLKILGISLSPGPAAPVHKPGTTDTNPAPPIALAPAAATPVDIRSFAAEKIPKTVNEKVAVIGYFLAHLAPPSERRDNLVSDDIKTYFIQAGFQLPTAPANMTLTNAKNAGYLNGLDRGRYKLNSVGYNLVAHKLPGGNAGAKKRKVAKRTTKPRARPKAK